MNEPHRITVRLETMDDLLVARVFSILKDRIQERCAAQVQRLNRA